MPASKILVAVTTLITGQQVDENVSIRRAREVAHKDRIDRTNHPTELALVVATAALLESTIDNSRI